MNTHAGHGLDPKSWGPHAWFMIHSLASMANTEQEKADFITYINSFAKIIPCSVCKKHFMENRQKFDIRNYMENAETLLMWTYIVHDAVNFAQQKTGSARPSWIEVRARYFKVDNDKNATPGTSEDYDPTICTEICGATVAKLHAKESENKLQSSSYVKIKTNKGNRK